MSTEQSSGQPETSLERAWIVSDLRELFMQPESPYATIDIADGLVAVMAGHTPSERSDQPGIMWDIVVSSYCEEGTAMFGVDITYTEPSVPGCKLWPVSYHDDERLLMEGETTPAQDSQIRELLGKATFTEEATAGVVAKLQRSATNSVSAQTILENNHEYSNRTGSIFMHGIRRVLPFLRSSTKND